MNSIGGFGDTYLGEASCFEARRAEKRGWGQLGAWGSAVSSLAGSGAELQPKSNLVPF